MHCLAIHDWDKKIGAPLLYAVALDFLQRLYAGSSGELYNCSLVIPEWPKAKKLSPKEIGDFINREERFVSIEGNFGLDNIAGVSDAHLSISGDASPARTFLLRIGDFRDELDPLLALMESLAGAGRLGYGYTFPWSSNKNPAFHAFGITEGYPSTEHEEAEADLDQAWFNEQVLGYALNKTRRYLDSGMLRDVYKKNILNINHIKRDVNGMEFSRAIEAGKWGHIKTLPNENWLWTVSENERRVAKVELARAGVLIAASPNGLTAD